MAVWKTAKKLGVIEAGGLTGPLCWAISLVDRNRCSARMKSAGGAASLDELAATKAWQEANNS